MLKNSVSEERSWEGDLTRVPFWVYQDDALLKQEQRAVFEGPVWNYLCLESEIAEPGDWRATMVGQMPVVVVRDRGRRDRRVRKPLRPSRRADLPR